MKLASLWPARIWTGAILTLLAGGWLPCATVRAGCGDYVVVQPETRNHSMPDQGTPSNHPTQPRQPFSPCTSAACVPPSDMTLATPSIAGEIDQWAWGNPSFCLLLIENEFHPLPGNGHIVQGLVPSIFHPPRSEKS